MSNYYPMNYLPNPTVEPLNLLLLCYLPRVTLTLLINSKMLLEFNLEVRTTIVTNISRRACQAMLRSVHFKLRVGKRVAEQGKRVEFFFSAASGRPISTCTCTVRCETLLELYARRISGDFKGMNRVYTKRRTSSS